MKVALSMIFLLLTGCGAESDTPWRGYAWNKSDSRFEWFYVWKETQEDCIKSMEFEVVNPPSNQWYSTPFGCGYSGNSYFKVRLLNEILGGDHIQCVVRNTAAGAKTQKVLYGPLLEGFPTSGRDFYCT